MSLQPAQQTSPARSGAALTALGVTFVVLAFLFGLMKVIQDRPRPLDMGPQALPGYGFPKTIRVANDRWETLVMRDMGMQAEVPPNGRALEFNFDQWTELDVANLDQFTGSTFKKSNKESCDIYAYVYQPTSTYAPTDLPKHYLKRLQSNTDNQDFKTRSQTIHVGGAAATEIDNSFTYKGEPYVDRAVYLYGHRSARVIDMVYSMSVQKQGQSDFARILASVKFIPNQDGTKWKTSPKFTGPDSY